MKTKTTNDQKPICSKNNKPHFLITQQNTRALKLANPYLKKKKKTLTNIITNPQCLIENIHKIAY